MATSTVASPATTSTAPDRSPTSTLAQPPTSTIPASSVVEVPPGVRWEEVALPSDTAISTAHRVVATASGFIALGHESQTNGGRPAIWTSPDGTTFERDDTAALSPPGSHLGLNDAAGQPGIMVAVGSRGSACERPFRPDFSSAGCARRDAIAWFSDGQGWQPATATDGSFEEGLDTSLRQVLAYEGGFIAVGRVILAREDWRVGIWRSDDGRTWTRTALVADADGILLSPVIAIAADQLLLAATASRCSTPRDVFGGFGFSVSTLNGRAFRSSNAVDWTPIDLVAEGLAVDDGPETCDPPPTAATPHNGVTTSRLSPLAEGGLWTGATGSFSTVDGTSWRALPTPPDFFLGTDNLVSRLRETFAGPAPDSLLLVSLGTIKRGRVPLLVATLDGGVWNDWSELAGTIRPLGSSLQDPFGGVYDLVATPTLAVMVGIATDETGGNAHAVAFTSRPTQFDPAAKVTCTPAPGAACAGAELTGAMLAGADLHGIDLTGALLTDVDLTGADLTGAKLDDAVLERSDLSGARLAGATLRRVEAASTPLDGADLTGVDATGANLGSAIGAIFASATLRNAKATLNNLSRADFRNADLTAMRLLKADLTGALLDGATLDDVSWWGSTCPDGVVLDEALDVTCENNLLG